MHLYEKQRAANDEQETQITVLNELVDQKGDFIKELAAICRVQRQAPEPVAVRGRVSSSLNSSAQESGCNEYGDVGARRGGGRKADPYKWFNSLDASKAAELCALYSKKS